MSLQTRNGRVSLREIGSLIFIVSKNQGFPFRVPWGIFVGKIFICWRSTAVKPKRSKIATLILRYGGARRNMFFKCNLRHIEKTTQPTVDKFLSSITDEHYPWRWSRGWLQSWTQSSIEFPLRLYRFRTIANQCAAKVLNDMIDN